ncbi:MAG: T9SS type A sorting domain-containing protein [Salinivirgaceae bacterium]|nr:T9SS type A sorting domain-containing protein [Salinivirgaceae bacterium]
MKKIIIFTYFMFFSLIVWCQYSHEGIVSLGGETQSGNAYSNKLVISNILGQQTYADYTNLLTNLYLYNFASSGAIVYMRELTICPGTSYYLGGDFQNTEGYYYDTLQAQSGIDSIIITNLQLFSQTVISIGDDYEISNNEAITLTPGPNFNYYNWYDGSHEISKIITTNDLTNGYLHAYVTVLDDNYCTATDSAFVHLPGVVGIKAFQKNLEVEIYPNPNKGEFWVNIPNSCLVAPAQLKITNSFGKQIQLIKLSKLQPQRVKLINFKPGLYILSLTTNTININKQILIN